MCSIRFLICITSWTALRYLLRSKLDAFVQVGGRQAKEARILMASAEALYQWFQIILNNGPVAPPDECARTKAKHSYENGVPTEAEAPWLHRLDQINTKFGQSPVHIYLSR